MCRVRGFAVVMTSLLICACASLPIQEMSDARQAINAARDAGAEQFAVTAFCEAERLLDVAESALERKDYESSRQAAVEAKKQAVIARGEALAKQGLTE